MFLIIQRNRITTENYNLWFLESCVDSAIWKYCRNGFENLELSADENGDFQTLQKVLKFPDTYARLKIVADIKINFAELLVGPGSRWLYVGKEKEYWMGEWLYMRRYSRFESIVHYKLMLLQYGNSSSRAW